MTTPKTFGKYQVRHEIGKGSMGVVYEAFDPVIERRVAVKVIRQDEFGATQGNELIARLKREAQAAGRLNHPGIVSIYDFGEDTTPGGSSIAFIAMEFIDGRELKTMLDAGQRCAPLETVRIVSAVLAALQHAHERGVTHRDIKPANVMLLADGTVKLADFGVARIEASELTQAGTIIGTPMYMSPEQILGLPVDGRSDLFSCGVLLYELLTGTKPFTGSVATVIRQVLDVDPAPPSRVDATLGPRWDALIRRALAKKPEQRFASAREMAAALQDAAQGDADATVAAAIRRPSAVAPAPRAAAGVGAGAVPRRGWRVGAVIAAALAATGAIYVAWRPGVPPAAPQPVAASAPDTAVATAGPAASAAVAVAAAASPTPAAAPTPAPPPTPSPASAATLPTAPTSPPAPPGAEPRPLAKAPRPVPVEPARAEAPVPPANAGDWAARLEPGRLEAAPLPTTLTAGLRRLLDPFDAADAARLIEFEALLTRQKPPFAYAIAVSQGRLVHAWAAGADAAAATGSARRRCAERYLVICQPVLVDGAFRRRSFFDVARALGSQPPRVVRSAWMQSVADAAVEIRREEAARQKVESARAAAPERTLPLAPAPAASPAVQAPAQMPALMPAAQAEWIRARTRLRDSGPRELARTRARAGDASRCGSSCRTAAAGTLAGSGSETALEERIGDGRKPQRPDRLELRAGPVAHRLGRGARLGDVLPEGSRRLRGGVRQRRLPPGGDERDRQPPRHAPAGQGARGLSQERRARVSLSDADCSYATKSLSALPPSSPRQITFVNRRPVCSSSAALMRLAKPAVCGCSTKVVALSSSRHSPV